MKTDTILYIEYYSHLNCNCYKLDFPYPKFSKETVVLCKVTEGLELAKTIAIGALVRHITKVLGN